MQGEGLHAFSDVPMPAQGLQNRREQDAGAVNEFGCRGRGSGGDGKEAEAPAAAPAPAPAPAPAQQRRQRWQLRQQLLHLC